MFLPAPGRWTIGSDDGFRRKEQRVVVVCEEPLLLCDAKIREIRATTTSAAVIEACDSAMDGDVSARRRLSRRYAEAVAAERAARAAERKAERAARAAAEAASRSESAAVAQTAAPIWSRRHSACVALRASA